jgi:hypothetical protein
MDKQVITAALVKEKAWAAYKAKKLTAQNVDNIRGKLCIYATGDGRFNCAVGSSFESELLEELAGAKLLSANTDQLELQGYIEIPLEDRTYIRKVQRAHDQWANVVRNAGNYNPAAVKAQEEHFVNLIKA